jgi:hypothetical protein
VRRAAALAALLAAALAACAAPPARRWPLTDPLVFGGTWTGALQRRAPGTSFDATVTFRVAAEFLDPGRYQLDGEMDFGGSSGLRVLGEGRPAAPGEVFDQADPAPDGMASGLEFHARALDAEGGTVFELEGRSVPGGAPAYTVWITRSGMPFYDGTVSRVPAP